MLGCSCLLFIEFSERFALPSELLQKRCGRPNFAVLLLEFTDSFIDCFQSDRVRIPHGTAAMGRESVAVQINDIDIDGAQRIALFKDTRAFVDERVEAALDDFFSRDLALRNSRFGGPLPHQLSHFGVGKGMPLVVILVPAGAGFLSIAPKLAKIIFSERLANAWLLQVTVFLADAPSNIETREVACRQRPHGHTVVVERFIDGFDARAFFYKELCFAAIGAEHAVADKTHAIADENADFSEPFRELHASCDDFPPFPFASHNFHQRLATYRPNKISPH